MSAVEYANSKRVEFLEQLKEFVRIPSISTLPEHHDDVAEAGRWLVDELQRIGMPTVNLYPTPGHPIVYAEAMTAPGAPTILVYGHYDVQPVDPEDEWTITKPFEPKVHDNKLYGRGSTDDKGQVFANIKAVEALMHAYSKRLPFNIKFLIEGEEEVSSENLGAFIANYQDMLRCDVVVVSDTSMMALDKPTIVYGLRGISYMEIEVKGPVRDLHSGAFGGAVHNPAQVLCEIIAALHKPDGSVNVEGFYDKVRPLEAVEREALRQIADPAEQQQTLRNLTGIARDWGEEGYSVSERIGARPTLEVNGLVSGFIGAGAKTVLPAKALAKVSCRLVPDQDPAAIEGLVRAQVQKLTPPTVTSEVRLLHMGHGAVVPIDSPAMNALSDAMEVGFGKRPLFQREGGSIPVVATFQSTFGVPVLLAGYGLPDDGPHGPNEKFDLESFYRGIITSLTLFENLSKISLDQFKA